MVDDLEESLSSSIAKLERCRLKHERMSSMLIAVKAGVKHLLDKVAPTMRSELGDIADFNSGGGELDDNDVATVLSDVERAVVRLVQRIKAAKADEMELLGGEGKDDGALLRMDAAPLLADDLEDAVRDCVCCLHCDVHMCVEHLASKKLFLFILFYTKSMFFFSFIHPSIHRCECLTFHNNKNKLYMYLHIYMSFQ
jgi:hypothetical protein